MSLVEGRRLSWLRLSIVLVVTAGLVFVGMRGWQWFADSRVEVSEQQWFAGYVDVTATPTYPFENPVKGTGDSAVLGFVVADPDEDCRPSWGAAYTLDEAQEQLDLDRRVARLTQLGGAPVISFGGQANSELALACDSVEDLTAAYSRVVERYDTEVVDLDVEGDALADTASRTRRAEALAALQDQHDTEVWLTLPVAPHGLPDDALAVVEETLAAGVDLAGVNVMTMNYAESRDPGQTMARASISALEATHEQLGRLYADRGDRRTDAELWRLVGATPMLGQNDVVGEVFGLDDAEQLHRFAEDKGLGRMSVWSLNRDRSCSSNWPDVTKVSDSCSGLPQESGAFARLLGTGVDAGPRTAATSDAPTDATPTTSAVETDDPDTSPYPVWNTEQAYQSGERVVWHRNVYVARYWTSGDVPDDPTVADADSPWRLVGPVLPGETPEPLPTVAPGTFPDWRPGATYTAGDRVQLGDVAYVAQWWTRGTSPDAPSTRDTPNPWRRLGADELGQDGPDPTGTPTG